MNIFFPLGYIKSIDSLALGTVSWKLGAGRTNSSDAVDHSVGLRIEKKPGEQVTEGETWVHVHHSQETLSEEMLNQLEKAVQITNSPPELHPIIIDIL